MTSRTAFPAVVSAALLLTACTGTAEEPPVINEVVTTTLAPEDGSSPTSQAGTTGTTAAPTATEPGTTPDAECSDPGFDLAETSFGRYTPIRTVYTDIGDVWLNFSIEENQFDPCLPLSWVVLSGTNNEGTNNDATHADGDRATISETVVFFHHTETVTDPAPPEFREVRSVTRTDDDRVEATYGNNGGGTFTVTHRWDGDRLITEGAQAGEYEQATAGAAHLDLRVTPPPHDAPVVPLGNARASRLAEQHELWGRTEPLVVSVPLADQELICSFAAPDDPTGVPVSCRGERVAWPEIDGGFGDGRVWQGPGPANGIGIGYMPTTVWTTVNAPTMPAPELQLPDEGLTRVGTYLVDTAGETAVFYSGASGARVGVEDIAFTDHLHVDTSRW